MDPQYLGPHWHTLGGTPWFFTIVPSFYKDNTKPRHTILDQAITIKILNILGRTHNFVVPQFIAFTTKTRSIPNIGNTFIYKNEERT